MEAAHDTAANFWVPTREAALRRLHAVDPRAYGRTRNFLDGAVTRLSPWITHGLIDVPEVIAEIRRRHRLATQDKLVFELAWREYYQHVWRHLGDGILADIRPGCSNARYAEALPPDIVTASTGVPVIDASVRTLYDTGYLHNHARMWLASYLVHLRKVRWRVAADWMFGYLLDGDLASNHLSWQWCAGTFSSKPYLFNAENVARYAPTLDCRGTAIDRSYADLDRIARGSDDIGPERNRPAPVAPPPLSSVPAGHGGNAAATWAGKRVGLVHPWRLRRPEGVDVAIGILHVPFHARYPWAAHRWHFVMEGMRSSADDVWIGDLGELLPVLRTASRVEATMTFHPGYREFLSAPEIAAAPAPRQFADPDKPCRSFSAFWKQVADGA
jgi:deoxyribodipyrimidine photo-lyase